MIWIRRLFALQLGIIFVALAIVIIVVFRINDVFLDSSSYIAQLRKADVYNFMYDELVPAGIEDLGKKSENLPVAPTLIADEAVSAIRETFPPEWVQHQVEAILALALPYLAGDTEQFEVTIPLAERVEAAGQALKRTTREGELINALYDEVLAPEVENTLANQDQLPFGMSLSSDDVISGIKKVAPPEWLQTQVDHTIDQVVPYLVGDRDSFAINISLADRTEALAGVLREFLKEGVTTRFLFDQAILPAIQDKVEPLVILPFGVTVEDHEVIEVLRLALSESWVEQRIEDITDEAEGYLTGRSDTIAVAIPLADRKAEAVDAISDLVGRKLEELYASLPVCTPEQAAGIDIATLAEKGLECQLPGITIVGIQQIAGVLIRDQAEVIIGNNLPDRWTFTDADLRSTLGDNNVALLDQVREWVTEGFAFTDTDLREALAMAEYEGTVPWDSLNEPTRLKLVEDSENVETLEEIRKRITKGLTLTDPDVREWTAGNSDRDFDQIRTRVGQARELRYVGWLILAGLLGAVGLLGGRGIPSKVAWAAVFLGIAAAIVWAASGPLYSRYAEPEIRSSLVEAFLEAEGVAAVALEKANTMIISAAGDFASGLANQALAFLAVAVVAFGVAMLWPILRRGKVG